MKRMLLLCLLLIMLLGNHRHQRMILSSAMRVRRLQDQLKSWFKAEQKIDERSKRMVLLYLEQTKTQDSAQTLLPVGVETGDVGQRL